MVQTPRPTKDKIIRQAKALAEQDAAKSENRDPVKVEELKEESDELLDEIDTLLEGQEVLAAFRQRGGQ
jgi:hypothetical protein